MDSQIKLEIKLLENAYNLLEEAKKFLDICIDSNCDKNEVDVLKSEISNLELQISHYAKSIAMELD